LASEPPQPAAAKALPHKAMKNLFLKHKPCAILLLLKDDQQAWYPSKLARTAGMSYVHTVNLLSKMREYGGVEVEKKGKQNNYRLTERGAYLSLVLDDFAKKCDKAESEQKAGPKQEAPPAHASSEPAPQKEKPSPAEKK